MNNKNLIKKRIIISVTLIFSLLVFIVSLSFAWFFDNKHAFVSGIHVSTEYANNLQIKGQKDLWGYEDNVEFDSDLTLDPVISDGKAFFRPIYGYDTEGSGVHQQKVIGYETIDNLDSYIYRYPFSLTVDNTCHVFLDTTKSSLLGSSNSKISDYGNFSTGHISAAMRVAFVKFNDDTYKYELKAVWIPNPKVELYTDEDGNLQLNENGKQEDKYTFIDTYTILPNGRINHQEMNISTDVDYNYVDYNGVRYFWGDCTVPIGELEGGKESKYFCYVWIDGNDRECHNSLNDGRVLINVHFYINLEGDLEVTDEEQQ